MKSDKPKVYASDKDPYFKNQARWLMQEAREMGIDVDWLEEDYKEDYTIQISILNELMKDED